MAEEQPKRTKIRAAKIPDGVFSKLVDEVHQATQEGKPACVLATRFAKIIDANPVTHGQGVATAMICLMTQLNEFPGDTYEMMANAVLALLVELIDKAGERRKFSQN